MAGWHFGSHHRRTPSSEAANTGNIQDQPGSHGNIQDQPVSQDRVVNRSSAGATTTGYNPPVGHNQFQTYSTPIGHYAAPGVPYYGPSLAPNLYPPHGTFPIQNPPVLDPLSYEQWQLNYALALSANEQVVRQQHAANRSQQSVPMMTTGREVSTKGQAEALSYKFWATGWWVGDGLIADVIIHAEL